MFEVLQRSTGKCIAVRSSGKLSHQDYQDLAPKLDELIEKHGSIRCLMEMTDFAGLELRALWDELTLDLRFRKHVERCAIVGNRSWEKLATMLSKPVFSKSQVRYFDASNMEEAWQWLTEGAETSSAEPQQAQAV
jgi:hypothetical protein